MSFKRLLFLMLLLVGTCFGQFNVTSRGPITGPCAGNPKLGIDYVNNQLYSCPGSLNGNTIGTWMAVGAGSFTFPPRGIPQTDGSTWLSSLTFSTDSTLSPNSDTFVSSQKAIKTFVSKNIPTFTPHDLNLQCDDTDEGTLINSTLLSVTQTYGGGIIQNQPGDKCYTGNTAPLIWQPQILWRGTGKKGCGEWGTCPEPSSYLRVGYNDTTYGAIQMLANASGGMSDLDVRNTENCGNLLYITQTQATIDNVSFDGFRGGNTVNTACNVAVTLATNTLGCTPNTTMCNFTGYHSIFNIWTNQIMLAGVLNATPQFTEWDVHGSSTDSNSGHEAILLQGQCNDPANKCGFTSLVCSPSDTVMLSSFNGGGSGATATVQCTGTNAIANNTNIVITNHGAGYTSHPTSATGSCPGTCSGFASLTTLALGPYMDLRGYSGGGGNATQNHIRMTMELGNAGNHTNPGDAHFCCAVREDVAGGNEVNVIADDSANAPYSADALFLTTTNAQRNDNKCLEYQTTLTKCFDDPNSGAFANTYWDVPFGKLYNLYIYAAHYNDPSFPANTANILVIQNGTGNTDTSGNKAAVSGTMTYTFTAGPLSGAYNRTPDCTVQDSTSISHLSTVSITTSGITVTTSGSTDTVVWHCDVKG